MEEIFKKPVQLSKGINVKDLMSHQGEFTLDMDFKPTKHGIDLTKYGDLMPDAEDEDDSDTDDVFEHVEKRLDEMMLSSPEYLTFEELSAKMVDVPCHPSGAVKITILEEGNGPLVPPDAEVTIHYAAYWEKLKLPFDSSLTINDGNHMRIHLGTGRCLPGIEIALTNVRGPTARLMALLEPEVTWRSYAVPPRIRPEPALFVIALYSVSDARAQHTFNELPLAEQTKYSTTIRTVQSLRNTAKDLFQRKKYHRAITTYQQAMYVLSLSRPETEQEEKQIKNLKIKQFVNLAVCYYKLHKPLRVIDMCENIDKIIHLDSHCKALFYKGKAYYMLGKLEEALENFKKALKLEPNNKEIGTLLAEIDGRIKKGKEDEVLMWQRAFKSQVKKEVVYNVDKEFESGVQELCNDLANRSEFTKVELPTGLMADEVACVRHEAELLKLRVEVEGEGRRRRVAIMKVLL